MNRVRRGVTERVRRRLPDRQVHRVVNGVPLTLPWVHRLPDYVTEFPLYGRNLVAVAEVVAHGSDLTMIDVGANVGDSALDVLAAVPAQVLCVEGDSYWLPYLERNTAAEPRITIAPVLLLPESATSDLVAQRKDGTSLFAPAADGATSAFDALPVEEVLERWPAFRATRLIKSDTDGYDTRLVPALCRALWDTHPVAFFEYDPPMSRRAGTEHPEQVWAELLELGYDTATIWDNFGRPRRQVPLDEMAALSTLLDTPRASRDHDFWDVAVTHETDDAVAARLAALVDHA